MGTKLRTNIGTPSVQKVNSVKLLHIYKQMCPLPMPYEGSENSVFMLIATKFVNRTQGSS
jgi:hypothetical protein